MRVSLTAHDAVDGSSTGARVPKECQRCGSRSRALMIVHRDDDLGPARSRFRWIGSAGRGRAETPGQKSASSVPAAELPFLAGERGRPCADAEAAPGHAESTRGFVPVRRKNRMPTASVRSVRGSSLFPLRTELGTQRTCCPTGVSKPCDSFDVRRQLEIYQPELAIIAQDAVLGFDIAVANPLRSARPQDLAQT